MVGPSAPSYQGKRQKLGGKFEDQGAGDMALVLIISGGFIFPAG